MQKKIIVLAIALAFAAPAAFADTDKAELEKLRAMVQELDQKIRTLEHKLERKNETAAPARANANTNTAASVNTSSGVTLYGQVNLSYDSARNGTTAAGVSGASSNKVSSNVSKFGIKGTEDLGDGLSVIWQIEQQVDIDAAAANTLASRNSFVGLSDNSMGKVLMGRHDTPYKLATRNLDLFADSIGDNRALMGGVKGGAYNAATANKSSVVGFDERPTDIIAYFTPDMGGFTGALAYVNRTEANTLALQAKSSITSVAGMYRNGPFFGSLAYETHALAPTVAVPTANSESATKLGLGYMMDALSVGFAYEKTTDNVGALGADLYGHNAYYLSGQYKSGKGAVKLAYAKAGQLGNTANTGANQFTMGYDHNMSKRTTLYGIYTRLSNQSAINYGLTTNATGGGATTQAGAGASPSAFSLGVKHSF